MPMNPWLEEKIKKANPPRTIALIVEVEDPTKMEAVKAQLRGISGLSIGREAFNMISVTAPSEAVPIIAKIPGITVHYDAPVYIKVRPGITDPLMGQIRISAVTVPLGPLDMAARFPLTAPLTGLTLLLNLFGRSPLSLKNPQCIIVPTSETRKFLEIPEDNKLHNGTKVAVLDTGVVYPHPLLHPTKGLVRMESTTGEPPLDLLGHGCVDEDAKVFTTFCGTEAIGKLWDKVDAPVQRTEMGEVKCLPFPTLTLGLKEGKTVLTKVLAIHRIPVRVKGKFERGLRKRDFLKEVKIGMGSITLTPWHPLYVATKVGRFGRDGHTVERLEARRVRAGQRLVGPVFDPALLQVWKKPISATKSYLAGLIAGDGTVINKRIRITKRRGRNRKGPQYVAWVPRYEARIADQDTRFLERVAPRIREIGAKPSLGTDSHGTGILSFYNKSFITSLKDYDLTNVSGSFEALRAWVAGFFDAEGHVDNDKPRVRISNRNYHYLNNLQTTLSNIGIPCKIYSHGEDGQLSISKRAFIKAFYTLIAPYSLHFDKLERLCKWIASASNDNDRFRPPFIPGENYNAIKVEKTSRHRGEFIFYDFTTEAGNYVANGVIVSNTWCITCAFGDTAKTRFGECRGVADPEKGTLMSVKCLSNVGFGTAFSVIEAMERAYKWGAKVISMSLGGPLQGTVDDDPECRIVARLKDDCIFVVAGGNDGPAEWTIGSPGASPHALTVGSYSTVYNGLSLFSSRGPSGEWYKEHPDLWTQDEAKYGRALTKPDVIAPGGGPVEPDQVMDVIYSGCMGWTDGMNDLTPGDGFEGMRGTSMATPHVAGLIALAYDRGLVKTAGDVKRLMARHGTKDKFRGYGLITWPKLQS